MDMDTNYETRVDILTMMFNFYGNVNDDKVISYTMALKDIPNGLLKIATQKCIYECDFPPTVSKIVKAARELKQEMEKTKRADFDEVLVEIKTNIRKYGGTRTIPKWSSDEVKQLVDAVGWSNLCNCTNDYFPTLRAQCRDLYAGICKRTDKVTANSFYLGINPNGLLGERVKQICGKNNLKQIR